MRDDADAIGDRRMIPPSRLPGKRRSRRSLTVTTLLVSRLVRYHVLVDITSGPGVALQPLSLRRGLSHGCKSLDLGYPRSLLDYGIRAARVASQRHSCRCLVSRSGKWLEQAYLHERCAPRRGFSGVAPAN